MKIKAKLYLGIGFLFLMILILAAVSTLFVSSLKKDTENVLSANYNSVEYARNMLHASDEIHLNKEAIAQLENNFAKQQLNVTEQGEKEITARLADQLNKLKANPEDVQVGKDFRADLVKLMTVNMDAIVMKSDHAKETASNAFVLISVIGALCFLIGFVLFVNLPSNIANPIKKLSESIKEISRQNYTHRVYFDGESEFAELAASYNTMAEKLQEYSNSKLDQILEEKKRVETLVNSMHDPVIGLDENRKIIFINDECLQVSGLKRKDLLHNNIDELINHNDLVRNLIDQNNRESTMKIFADNKESYFEKEVIPMEITPTGELKSQKIGEVIVLKNITTFKELDVAKTNFIATVSHELRTPIASIQLSSELLKHPRTGSLTDEQKTLLEGIEEDSLRLLRITSELLNVSQVETGNIKLYSQISDPLPIIQYALNATRMQAEQKHIEISTDIDENIAKIFVDEEKTAWVLTNFITNAIRYSPVNSKIMVSLKKENNHLLFSVKDHGKGIDAAYKNKVFDRYFQIPGSVRTGTGLGLSISKDFIENQGGKIGVDSELGVGSTFYFRLPMVTT
ncbi:PAS domain-containing sensor histidine kinase [Sphingobacterium cellulitidis]|uniref:HAMP domain-containing sensor histidine kinase n=1 Tax=Sphingobacterium cellulitidis TaxID=1768011 RepID=UPI000B943669|nr:ATP-binding protein [Sphingobacterium cellulitidis]OYD41011.1 PAS domain-containing sensor histidine kinase [Sphingobacterium cellulitidis]OYD44400.1 PAS domain-containing sensor histidine kinase [Sphingobacterium cellulitidis]